MLHWSACRRSGRSGRAGRRNTLGQRRKSVRRGIDVLGQAGERPVHFAGSTVIAAVQFTAEDEAQRKSIEVINTLQNFVRLFIHSFSDTCSNYPSPSWVWGLKSQMGDQMGLSGKNC